jgi:hypothetical protein
MMGPVVGGVLLSCDYFREDQLSELTIADTVLACNKNLTLSSKTEHKPMAKQEEENASAIRGVMTRINQRGWRDLKLLALERGTTLNALAVEAFNDVLRKYGKRASVENPLVD